jgi:hypothetical protein
MRRGRACCSAGFARQVELGEVRLDRIEVRAGGGPDRVVSSLREWRPNGNRTHVFTVKELLTFYR